MLAPPLGHAWELAGTAEPHARQDVSDIVGEERESGGKETGLKHSKSNPETAERELR
jgi:hypothetical protein